MSSLHIGARRRNGLRRLERRVARLEKLMRELLETQNMATGQVRAQWKRALEKFDQGEDNKERS